MSKLNFLPFLVDSFKIIGVGAVLNLIFITIVTASSQHREHKVHNIVLYPDKHSWCKTLPIKQVVSYPGCESLEIDNNVCVGTCFSYSIPHTEPSDPGEVIVPYCDSCQPSDTTWHHVTLQCSKYPTQAATLTSTGGNAAAGSAGGVLPPSIQSSPTAVSLTADAAPAPGKVVSVSSTVTPAQMVKRVQLIHNCSCSSCSKLQPHSSSSEISHLDAMLPLPTKSQNNFDNNEHSANAEKSYSAQDIAHILNSVTKLYASANEANDEDIEHDESDIEDMLNDIPDLLDDLQHQNGSGLSGGRDGGGGTAAASASSDSEQLNKSIFDHKLISLLKSIQERNLPSDKEQLIDLLRIVYDSDDGSSGTEGGGGANGTPSTRQIADFVENSIAGHQGEQDVTLLKDVLLKFENSKLYEKHRKYLEKLENLEKSDFNGEFRRADESGVDNVENHNAHQESEKHHRRRHHMHHDDHDEQNGNVDDAIIVNHHHQHDGGHHQQHHKHHHEKLDVHSHELKPNHAGGSLLSYSNHQNANHRVEVDGSGDVSATTKMHPGDLGSPSSSIGSSSVNEMNAHHSTGSHHLHHSRENELTHNQHHHQAHKHLQHIQQQASIDSGTEEK